MLPLHTAAELTLQSAAAAGVAAAAAAVDVAVEPTLNKQKNNIYSPTKLTQTFVDTGSYKY